MSRYNRLADVPGIGYAGPSRPIKGKRPQAKLAKELQPDTSMKPERLLRRLDIALELPGEPIEYHFVIERTCELLVWLRREHPRALDEAERLALLDVKLIEACPNIIEFEPGRYHQVQTFLRLARLYAREGELRQELEFVERGARYHQEGLAKRAEQLRARVRALEEEGLDLESRARVSSEPSKGSSKDPNGKPDGRTPQELLDYEHEQGVAERFAKLDSLIGRVLVRTLRGERSLSGGGHRVHDPIFMLEGTTPTERELLDEFFSLERQRKRGAWWVPEQVRAMMGVINFPAILSERGRFAHSYATQERYVTTAKNSPETVLIHAVLNPLFSALYEPFGLRGEQTAKLNKETEISRWEEASRFFEDLGFDVNDELSAMRYGSGWSELSAAERLAAKRRLSVALAEQAHPEAAALYRARCLLALNRRYYSKANAEGHALAEKVLTGKLELTVSGFFGGGWLDFLDYLGEEPHPEERVVRVLPKVGLRLGVDACDRASPAAPRLSPIERRVEVLRKFWRIFDDLHARQKSSMPSLWGLVDEYGHIFPEALYRTKDSRGPESHHPMLYRTLLPEDLQRDIEELWGTTMLPAYPARIVSEPLPYARMAEAFGPALRFWEGTALTAWFVCEGPYSRTDMHGLETYHRETLKQLERLGTPVESMVFEELKRAEDSLGPEKASYRRVSEREVAPGIIMETSFGIGSGREGFEGLRDAVTHFRRTWAEEHLERYLKACSESEIRAVAEAHALASASRRGRPPTPRQFAATAERVTRLWFGGDMAMLYRTFRQKPPFNGIRSRLLPQDALSFIAKVYRMLGGKRMVAPVWGEMGEAERMAYEKTRRRERARASLATKAIDYMQLSEALGRSPSFKEFTRSVSLSGFDYAMREILDQEASEAYRAYARIIEEVAHSARAWE